MSKTAAIQNVSNFGRYGSAACVSQESVNRHQEPIVTTTMTRAVSSNVR